MKVEFLEPALSEYREAIEFYNLQSDGLGNKFIMETDRIISIIKNYPEGFSIYSKRTRRALLNVFPYSVVYSIIDNHIIIFAVAHQHRKPRYWGSRAAK